MLERDLKSKCNNLSHQAGMNFDYSPERRARGADNLLRRETKVSNLCTKFAVDEYIVRLQVPVNDLRLGRVQETDALGNITKNRKQQIAIERETFVVQNIVQRAHVHVLHDEHRLDALFDDSSHYRCDARVAHLAVMKKEK